LIKQGFHGKIFCSPATYDLCKILLPDSGKLQEEEAEYANKHSFSKHHPALPLYTRGDAERAMGLFYPKEFDKEFSINDKFRIELSRAGHILGASLVKVKWGNESLVFTGDLGRPHDLVMLSPDFVENADYLVTESTYGDKKHDTSDTLLQLETIIQRTFQRGGSIVISAFSVGRSQTLLYALSLLKKEKRIPKIPIYLDSPMSIDVTEIFQKYQGEHRLSPESAKAACEVATPVRLQEESKSLDKVKAPMIILSASGMATGGRVLHHLKVFAPDPKNTLLFAGFQAAATRGADMVAGAKFIKIHGESIKVEAEVININTLSAHADQSEMLDWLSHFKSPPRQTFITHGEPEAAKAMKVAIESRFHWRCRIPKYLDSFDLA
jgi:metallo-beta-lactamase family protein